jgi:uncharacterized protein YcbX
MSALVVSQLYIYPVKSLGGIEVSKTMVLPKGLQYDRRWMLIDENNRFLTQREHPEMAFIKTSFDNESILIHYNDSTLTLPYQPKGDDLVADVWEDTVDVQEVDETISKWFSHILKMSCKLVAFPEVNARWVDPDYAIQPDNQTSLSDGYPILIIGQSSLDDLNGRLESPVSIDRFRPNIVFTGGTPYEEDQWNIFTIGDVEMKGVKPCARCVMTTIDQQTGKQGKEPLATLSSYRKIGNKVLFGQNVIPINTGLISVGDRISLL